MLYLIGYWYLSASADMDQKLFFFDWLGKLISLSLKSFYADVCLSMNLEGFFTLHDLFFFSMTRTGKGL